MRIDPSNTPKEPTYQVVLDALALTACYPAFLITAKVSEIYMHQFWHTITMIKNSSSYKFKLDKKKFTIDVKVFCDILLICLRLPNQEFDAPPLDEEIVTFIKGLGHKGDIKSVTEVGMYYNKKVDFVELLWEDFVFQIDNKDAKKKEKMYYPRFTKAIIHHFIFKDKSISMWNRIFMHTVRVDNILGSLRFISKSDEYQVYGALLLKEMTNQKMRDSPAYKAYLAFAPRAATPKKEKKFKKHSSLSKKKALVAIEEPVEKPKAEAKAERSKGIEMLSEAASLEEAQLKIAIKRSKREINIHQVGVSSEGADLESDVPVEPKGKSVNTSEGTGLKPRQSDDERTEFDDDRSVDLNKIDDDEKDEFVHTPDDYVPTDDKNVDDEEYKRINKDMYDNVNVELKDTKPANEENGNEEMTHAENVNVEHEEVSQEVAGEMEIISMMDIKVQHEDPNLSKEPSIPAGVVEKLKQQDKPQKSVEDIRKVKMEHTAKQQEFQYTIKSSDKALYHALMESILADEDAMDKSVADNQKKRNLDDTDRDEDPPARPDQGLKRKKTGKDTEQSKKAKSTETSKGERKPRKGKNQIKTGKKREAWRSPEMSKAISVKKEKKLKKIQVKGPEICKIIQKITSPEVTHEIHDPEGCNFLSEDLPDIDSFNDTHLHFDDNPLSGSTTYSSNSLLEEFTDELALITYPLDYDDNLKCDIESDLREIEFLLYQGEDSDLKDSIDQTDLLNFVDPTPKMFTDEHAPDYSFPPRFDVYPDDFLEIESDADNFYDDPFYSKGEKIKESKLLIDELDLPCDFLPYSENDSFGSQDFSKDDELPSPDNEDKVFNPGILIQEKLVTIITRVAQEKKLAISSASLVFEDFNPPFYELLVFKDVPNLMRLLPFSSENKEKVFKPGIYTSEKVYFCFLPELSHPGYRVFKVNLIFISLMRIFHVQSGKNTPLLDVLLGVKDASQPPTLDPEWNESKTVNNYPTHEWLSDFAKAKTSSKTFDDLMSTPIDFTAFAMNRLQISDLTQDILIGSAYKILNGTYASKRESKHDVYSTKRIFAMTNVKINVWYGYGHLEDIEVRRFDQQLYKFMEGDGLNLLNIEDMLLFFVQNIPFNLKGENIVHLATALRMFTRRIVIQKRVEDL
uniref:Uncharacterized protein n=1 Tax=Tanacetum cinerariifolium TaxID=118510 RepID=A0A6L2NE11_TANCI|nr:hypothetical protein [Tanacetum cinerariifolium]